jgi:hypothetical protein
MTKHTYKVIKPFLLQARKEGGWNVLFKKNTCRGGLNEVGYKANDNYFDYSNEEFPQAEITEILLLRNLIIK